MRNCAVRFCVAIQPCLTAILLKDHLHVVVWIVYLTICMLVLIPVFGIIVNVYFLYSVFGIPHTEY